jgi:Arc/MetJ family transcription regulator
MQTTLNIDEESLSTAARLTGVRKKTELVRMGLEALIAREAAKKLAALGGSDRAAAADRRSTGLAFCRG